MGVIRDRWRTYQRQQLLAELALQEADLPSTLATDAEVSAAVAGASAALPFYRTVLGQSVDPELISTFQAQSATQCRLTSLRVSRTGTARKVQWGVYQQGVGVTNAKLALYDAAGNKLGADVVATVVLNGTAAGALASLTIPDLAVIADQLITVMTWHQSHTTGPIFYCTSATPPSGVVNSSFTPVRSAAKAGQDFSAGLPAAIPAGLTLSGAVNYFALAE